LTLPQFLDLMTSAQESIVNGSGPPAWMNETQMFWLPQQQQVGRTSSRCKAPLLISHVSALSRDNSFSHVMADSLKLRL
jgi:hypothetical protein